MGLAIEYNELTRKCVDHIDEALACLGGDKYIGIVVMHYIEGQTMEYIAEVYDISTVAAYSQRKRLINKLASILCSEEAIKELLNR